MMLTSYKETSASATTWFSAMKKVSGQRLERNAISMKFSLLGFRWTHHARCRIWMKEESDHLGRNAHLHRLDIAKEFSRSVRGGV